ncbi:tyrosine--tRNA ligase [Candidatus Wolfebacteria bacterium]|nr:tyrosine--tRNA ligase [Candidatus Wolfebacteria bacterium]
MTTKKQNLYDVLKERGFIEQSTDEKALRRLLSQKKISFYNGFDPTADSFHIGNLVPIMALAHGQKQGHQPVFVIGGGTGLVGDPSGKDKARPIMSRQKINQNIQALKKQISSIIDFTNNKALFINNAKWLTKLNYIEFLRDFGIHFSINRLLTMESIKRRLKKGLSFLEFNYQLLQAYDFWHLFKKYNCLLQTGGSDQWGNIIAGVELIRRIENKTVHCLTFPLLQTANGKKMGKTEKGAIWLNPKKISPYEYYQFWINTDDRDVIKFMKIFTFLPMEKIKDYAKLKDSQIKKAKEILAFEATKIIHGEKEAQKAQSASSTLFGKEKESINSIPTVYLKKSDFKKGIPVSQIFVMTKLCKSLSEIRRLINQGGAYLNKKRLENPNLLITINDFKTGNIILRLGKKKYQKVKIK